jgi:hypothetical protein
MAKRLQVILQDTEYRDVQRAARAQNVTVAAWVRQALATARRREPLDDTGRKFEVVRDAVRHAFPTADIDAMNADIERGYRTVDEP